VIRDLVALFGAGVASFLAPCVVPLLPAYVAMLTGESKRVVPATLLFISGFTMVFAGLGVAAGALGSALDDFRTGLERGGGVVVVLMGFALLDLIHIRERRAILTVPKGLGPARPVVLGIAFGAAWSPCVGPLLGAALVVAASSSNPARGGTLLGAYALGIGVPFLIGSLGLASSERSNDFLRRISRPLQRVAGGLLLVLGVLLVTGWYDHLTSYLARFTPTVSGL